MITIVLFALAAAAGTLARAESARRWNQHAGIPAGTLAVNVTGSFCLGLLTQLGSPAITVVGVGALGAYTTFSSFARDTVALAEDGNARQVAAYVAATCILGIAAAALGVALADV